MTEQRSHLRDAVQSRVEFLEDGDILWDYRTAHGRAGDPDNKTFLPKTCKTCHEQEKSAKETGVTVTKVDEEWSA